MKVWITSFQELFSFMNVQTNKSTLCFFQRMTKTSEIMNPPSRKMSLTVKTPFMIGVAGGTASGKSTVCKRLMETLGQNDMTDSDKKVPSFSCQIPWSILFMKVVSLSQDAFYRELNEEESILANLGKFNFDHPDAFDTDLMVSVLQVRIGIINKYCGRK